MTTPYQPAPDGAYVVGGGTTGGGSYQYGQGMTENLATDIFNPMAALGDAMGSIEGALEMFEQILLTLPLEALQLFRPLLGVIEPFVSVVSAAADIAGALILRPVMATVEYVVQAILDLINRLLAPFGQDGEFGSLQDALNVLVQTLTAPWTLLGGIEQWVSDLFDQHAGRITKLEDRLSAQNLALDPDTIETGDYNGCESADKFLPMVGYDPPAATGWGAITSDTYCPVLYDQSVDKEIATERHGAGITIKSRRIGITYVVICSNDDMTNAVALRLEHPVSGSDTVTIGTLSGPEMFTPQTDPLNMRVSSETFWAIRYDPYDEAVSTSNKFWVFCNGQAVLSWQDNGNIVIHGSDHRDVGLILNGLNHPTRRGWDVTDFTYFDWTQAAPQ